MTKEEAKLICEKYEIQEFTVSDDGLVDIAGNVDLRSKNLTEIPVIFGTVGGDFDVAGNELVTLRGSPYKIGGEFNCSHNRLKSLSFGPTIVNGNYNCSNNNLETLSGSPKEISGTFSCFINILKNLEGGPEKVYGDFFMYDNEIISLKGSPKIIDGDFYAAGCPKLLDLAGCPEVVGGDFVIDATLPSLFSGETDCEVKGLVRINPQSNYDDSKMHPSIFRNQMHLKYVLKYQRYLEIWNLDSTLNVEYFNELIEEIKHGLL